MEANESLLGMEGQLQGGSVNQIYQVALGLSILVMLTGVLMISSSMNSNVAQRTQFFGLLRCQGATPKQIMRFVRREGLHWCKTAVPMGIALSIVVVWILCAAMRRLSPSWFWLYAGIRRQHHRARCPAACWGCLRCCCRRVLRPSGRQGYPRWRRFRDTRSGCSLSQGRQHQRL